jgi:hypothetical protein
MSVDLPSNFNPGVAGEVDSSWHAIEARDNERERIVAYLLRESAQLDEESHFVADEQGKLALSRLLASVANHVRLLAESIKSGKHVKCMNI